MKFQVDNTSKLWYKYHHIHLISKYNLIKLLSKKKKILSDSILCTWAYIEKKNVRPFNIKNNVNRHDLNLIIVTSDGSNHEESHFIKHK